MIATHVFLTNNVFYITVITIALFAV